MVVTATWAIFEEFNFQTSSVFQIFQKLNSFEINPLYGTREVVKLLDHHGIEIVYRMSQLSLAGPDRYFFLAWRLS